jgi:hypothetical protein
MGSSGRVEEVVTVVSAGVVTTLIGLVLAQVSVFLLPVVQLLAIYPFYFKAIKAGELGRASLLVFLWAVSVSASMVAATFFYKGLVAGRVINGEAYVSEMLDWIRTGLGPEGDPRLFLLPKLRELVIFTVLSVASIGLLGLLLGAILLNYMNYYVGTLLSYAKPEFFLQVALLSWQIYAILRVVGYVLLGVALSRISYLVIFQGRYALEKSVKRLLLWSLVFIVLDFILKGTVANTVYQPLLRMFTNV